MLPATSPIGLVDLVSEQWAWSVTSPTELVARQVFREDCPLKPVRAPSHCQNQDWIEWHLYRNIASQGINKLIVW